MNIIQTKQINRTLCILAALLMTMSFAYLACSQSSKSYAAASGTFRLIKQNRLRVRFIKNKSGSRTEYGRASGFKASGYSIFQGACSDGKWAYHVLYNKKKEKCRIVKLDPASHKVIKVSRAYKMYHGNDMAYDSKRNRLIVVHGDGDTMRLSVFDPESLRRKSVVRLNLHRPFKGAAKKAARKLKGVTGIAYDKKHDRFIASVKSTFHYVILNAKFKPVRLIRTRTRSKKLQKQGMDIAGKYLLRIMNVYTKKSIRNYIYIYNMKGKYIKRIRIATTSEVESSYFLDGRMYLAAYIEKGKGRKFRNWSYLATAH